MHLELTINLEMALRQATEDLNDARAARWALGEDFGTQMSQDLAEDVAAAEQRVHELRQDVSALRRAEMAELLGI